MESDCIQVFVDEYLNLNATKILKINNLASNLCEHASGWCSF